MPNFSIEAQIKELNSTVKCSIRPSKIAGVGVFALRDIKQGEKLYLLPGDYPRWFAVPYERFNEIRPEVREVILARWPSVVLGSMFRSPNDDCLLASFVNHSDNPNYDQKTDSALRDIAKGEEITEDYRAMPSWELVFPWLKN